MSEGKKAEVEEKLSLIGSEIVLWQGLLEHPGWKKYVELVRQQQTMRHHALAQTPLTSFSAALPNEYMKGEASGLGLALALPEAQVEAAEINRTRLKVELENTSDETQPTTADARSRVDDDDFSRE